MASAYVKDSLKSLNLPSLSLSADDINILLDEPSTAETSNLHRSQETNVRAKLELETIKSDYLLQISSLQSQLESQVKDNRNLQAKLETVSRVQPQKWTRPVEDKLVPEAEMLKNNLYNILPSDLQYVELQAIPESKRTLLDQVRGRVYEELHHMKSDNDLIVREVATATLNEVDTVRHRNKLLEEEVKHKANKLLEQHVTIQRLEHELGVEREKLSGYTKQIAHCDDLQMKLDNAHNENAKLERAISDSNETLKTQQQYRDKIEKDKADLMKQVDIFKLDKTYLEKELHALNIRHQTLEEKFAQRSSDLEKAKELQLTHFQSVLNQSEQNRNAYESRLQEELSSIRKRGHIDMEEIRRNTRDYYEREIRTLKDSLATVSEDCRRHQSTIETLRAVNNDLQQQYTHDKTSLKDELSTLTQQNKMKSFESDRFRIIYEESVHALKKVQLQNEKYTQKLDILSQEFQHCQSDYKARVAELELLANARLQKLKLLGGDDVIIAPQIETGRSHSLPDNVKQLREQLENFKTRNIRLTAEVQLLEDLLSKSREPFPAFVETVREKDSHILDLRETVRNLENKLGVLESEFATLQKERNQMAVDLESLRLNRRQVGEMKKALQELVGGMTPGQKMSFAKTASVKKILGC